MGISSALAHSAPSAPAHILPTCYPLACPNRRPERLYPLLPLPIDGMPTDAYPLPPPPTDAHRRLHPLPSTPKPLISRPDLPPTPPPTPIDSHADRLEGPEVAPLIDALGRNSSLVHLDLTISGLGWPPAPHATGAPLIAQMARSAAALAGLRTLVISSASRFHIPVARLRKRGAEAEAALQERPFFSPGGPLREEIMLSTRPLPHRTLHSSICLARLPLISSHSSNPPHPHTPPPLLPSTPPSPPTSLGT